MRRVVPRAGIILLCVAVLAIAALSAGSRRADPGTGLVTSDTTWSLPPASEDGTMTTDSSPTDSPAPDAPPAETPPAKAPAGTPSAEAAPPGTAPPVKPSRDSTPPNTAIASAVVDGSRATFTFTSTEAHSVFQC
ncbi:MAG TPA: hypothetical protein VJS45_11860, partial [Acidimicrobiia bacterium]|nr:hypothetical protein [Acidimicrobiia bacterium]